MSVIKYGMFVVLEALHGVVLSEARDFPKIFGFTVHLDIGFTSRDLFHLLMRIRRGKGIQSNEMSGADTSSKVTGSARTLHNRESAEHAFLNTNDRNRGRCTECSNRPIDLLLFLDSDHRRLNGL